MVNGSIGCGVGVGVMVGVGVLVGVGVIVGVEVAVGVGVAVAVGDGVGCSTMAVGAGGGPDRQLVSSRARVITVKTLGLRDTFTE